MTILIEKVTLAICSLQDVFAEGLFGCGWVGEGLIEQAIILDIKEGAG